MYYFDLGLNFPFDLLLRAKHFCQNILKGDKLRLMPKKDSKNALL